MFLRTRDETYRSSIFNDLVAPRPIGWVSTLSEAGIPNLAPFSYFNGVSSTPPMVMFACNEPSDRTEKDSLRNARATGEFCVNLTSYALREKMNLTSSTVPYGVDEFQLAGLEKAACELIRCPRVLLAPASLECTVLRIVDIEPSREPHGANEPRERTSSVVLGRVVAIHLRDDYLDEQGRFDVLKAQPLARLGGCTYLRPTELFELPRPDRRSH